LIPDSHAEPIARLSVPRSTPQLYVNSRRQSKISLMMRPDTKSGRGADADGKNSGEPDQPEILDPNDTNLVRDRIKGQTDEHAQPPRLEDEGQSGG
jgi:hypothetical protein